MAARPFSIIIAERHCYTASQAAGPGSCLARAQDEATPHSAGGADYAPCLQPLKLVFPQPLALKSKMASFRSFSYKLYLSDASAHVPRETKR